MFSFPDQEWANELFYELAQGQDACTVKALYEALGPRYQKQLDINGLSRKSAYSNRLMNQNEKQQQMNDLAEFFKHHLVPNAPGVSYQEAFEYMYE
jgi:hypothetical protein